MNDKAETCDISWCVSLRAADSVYCTIHRGHPEYGPSRPNSPEADLAWKLWKQVAPKPEKVKT